MTKKKIILSLAIVLGTGLLVTGALFLFKSLQTPTTTTPVNNEPKPGDALSLSDTPQYETCKLVAVDAIKNALGTSVTNVTAGERSGVIAINYESSEECSYSFATNSSDNNTFIAQTYAYTANVDRASTEQMDTSWRNVSKLSHPTYTLSYPAYLKIDNDETKTSILRVITGAKNFLFTIEQPSEGALSDEDTEAALIKIAVAAQYGVAASKGESTAPAN